MTDNHELYKNDIGICPSNPAKLTFSMKKVIILVSFKII